MAYCKEQMILGSQANECPVRKRDEKIENLQTRIEGAVGLLVRVRQDMEANCEHSTLAEDIRIFLDEEIT